MSDIKDILYSFSNGDTVDTVERINTALYSRANEYISSRKQDVAKTIFDNSLDDNQPE